MAEQLHETPAGRPAYSTAAAVSLPLAFLVPPAGLVAGLIGLHQTNAYGYRGHGLAAASTVLASVFTTLLFAVVGAISILGSVLSMSTGSDDLATKLAASTAQEMLADRVADNPLLSGLAGLAGIDAATGSAAASLDLGDVAALLGADGAVDPALIEGLMQSPQLPDLLSQLTGESGGDVAGMLDDACTDVASLAEVIPELAGVSPEECQAAIDGLDLAGSTN